MSTAQNAVTAEAGNSSATIRARVGDSAIDKVTRLFSASLADIFTETLQNSRRGGANSVAATIVQDGDITRVTLADDGEGIGDPAVLLTFGESNWKAGIAEAEDPAGFGLLALSRGGAAPCAGASPAGTQAPATAWCWSPLTSSAEMRPMSSRTTALPGPMEPRSPSKRPRRPIRGPRLSRDRRAALSPAGDHRRRDCRAPRLPRRRAPCRAMEGPRVRRFKGTGMRATASPTSTSMA